MTFELIDLQDLGKSALQDFTQTLGARPAGMGDFVTAAERLVAKVEFAYAVAAKLAHREATLEGTVAIWSKMLSICDEAATEIERNLANSPKNKTSLDRILDLRNAAERRRELHS